MFCYIHLYNGPLKTHIHTLERKSILKVSAGIDVPFLDLWEQIDSPSLNLWCPIIQCLINQCPAPTS